VGEPRVGLLVGETEQPGRGRQEDAGQDVEHEVHAHRDQLQRAGGAGGDELVDQDEGADDDGDPRRRRLVAEAEQPGGDDQDDADENADDGVGLAGDDAMVGPICEWCSVEAEG
jgi:hypothetical protein